MNDANTAKPEWSVREYLEGDEEGILELRGIALSGSKNRQWWDWQFKNGPAGPANIWLAVAGQKIIGQNAQIPLPMKIGEQICKGSIAVDVITHPDYQRQGIQNAIRKQLFDSNRGKGISISYGTATRNIFPLYGRMDSPYPHFNICQPALLVKIISLGKLLTSRYKIPGVASNLMDSAWARITSRTSSFKNTGIITQQVSSFDESIDAFWQKASGIKRVMVVKNMKYLNWRYVEKPGKEYKIFIAKRNDETVGYVVLKLENNTMTRGFIVDLLALPDEDIITQMLIARAMEYFRAEGVATVLCLMLTDTPYYGILRKLGFMQRNSGLQLGTRLYDRNLPRELVTDPANWYFVWGDNDTR